MDPEDEALTIEERLARAEQACEEHRRALRLSLEATGKYRALLEALVEKIGATTGKASYGENEGEYVWLRFCPEETEHMRVGRYHPPDFPWSAELAAARKALEL